MQPDEIAEYLFSMAGNAGQQSILAQGMPTFIDWVQEANDDDNPPDYETMVGMLLGDLGPSKYDATDLIWDEGYLMANAAWEEQDNEEQFAQEVMGRATRGRRARDEERRADEEKEKRRRERTNSTRQRRATTAAERRALESAARRRVIRKAARIAAKVVFRI